MDTYYIWQPYVQCTLRKMLLQYSILALALAFALPHSLTHAIYVSGCLFKTYKLPCELDTLFSPQTQIHS